MRNPDLHVSVHAEPIDPDTGPAGRIRWRVTVQEQPSGVTNERLYDDEAIGGDSLTRPGRAAADLVSLVLGGGTILDPSVQTTAEHDR